MSSPEIVAGQIVRESLHLEEILDERVRKELEARLAGVLPGDVVAPALTINPRKISPDDLQRLIRNAAVVAAGLDPALTNDPPPPVLWERGGSRLLVLLAGVRAKPGDGLVDIIVPVQCDELAQSDRLAEVTVTFVTGSPDRPAGGLAVTEDRPRGPALVVEVWHEQLIAFAWHTFVKATAAMAQPYGYGHGNYGSYYRHDRDRGGDHGDITG